MKTVRLSLMFWAIAAQAQFPFPGQGPYGNPGGYPNGRGRPQQQPQQQQQQNSRSNRAATLTTEGMVRRVAGSQLVIEADDHRVIWYRITAQTVSQKNGGNADVASFQPGDRVSVDSSENDAGDLTATSVNWERAGSPDERAMARETWDMPGVNASSAPSGRRDNSRNRDDDDDRPILRRKNDDSASAAAPQDPPPSAPAPQSGTAPGSTSGSTASSTPGSTSGSDDAGTSTLPATQMRPPDAPADPDDPGRPVLRRGGAATARQPVVDPSAPGSNASGSGSNASGNGQAANNNQQPTLMGRSNEAPIRPSVSQPILPQEDPLIGKVREAAYNFTSSLPNFFCQQITTRYGSQNPKQGWDTLDLVTADVQYLNGQESYKNIKASGKAVQSMDQLEGTRSTGEFSSMLEDLMSPATGATFRRTGTDSIHGRSTIVFKVEIPRERSHWRIEAPSQLYYPAIRGSIWVDRDTSRVMRIEMSAYNLPRLFPFDTVEAATDYDFTRLAGEQEFLLPADAEVLNCERGSSSCSRNRIEFHNYKKFDAATSITFGTN
jgi:hypothetical protein